MCMQGEIRDPSQMSFIILTLFFETKWRGAQDSANETSLTDNLPLCLGWNIVGKCGQSIFHSDLGGNLAEVKLGEDRYSYESSEAEAMGLGLPNSHRLFFSSFTSFSFIC